MMNTQALTKMSPEQPNTNVMATEPTAPTSGTKGSDKKEEGLKFSLSDVQQLISHALVHNQSNGNGGHSDTSKKSEPRYKDNAQRGKDVIECGYCSKRGHKMPECRTRIRDFKQKFMKKAKAEKHCYECFENTHLQWDCPYFQPQMGTESRRSVTEMVQQFLTNQINMSKPSTSNQHAMLALPSGPSATCGVDLGNLTNAKCQHPKQPRSSPRISNKPRYGHGPKMTT